MQPIQNTILQSTAASANGAWRNTSNFVSCSVEFAAFNATTGAPVALPTGIDIWVEVSNDPLVNTDNTGTQIAAPSAPVLSQFTPSNNGDQQPYNIPAATYSVKLTYTNPEGETVGSTLSTLAVTAGNTLAVGAPGPDPTTGGPFATGYNVYISINSGPYILQNPLYNSNGAFGNTNPNNGPLNVNQAFILYSLITNGAAIPTTNTTGTPNVGANISGNVAGSPIAGNNQQVAYDTGTFTAGTTKVAMWLPSGMYFNWLRARMSGSDGTTEIIAYLFGQNG